MLDLKALSSSDIIALLAMLASTLSAFYAYYSARSAKHQFAQVEKRERGAQVAANYLALETSSSEIFKYTADNETKIAPLRGSVKKAIWSLEEYAEARGILINLYYQSLNLFEVCARFRRQDLIKPEVFASWIAWMVEILEDSFFRDHWASLIRSNYTRDVREIFDVGVDIFSRRMPEERRNDAFYAAAAEIMGNCPKIAGWLADIKEETKWESLKSSRGFLSNGTSLPRPPAKRRRSPAASSEPTPVI
jgi:hypothetical protein